MRNHITEWSLGQHNDPVWKKKPKGLDSVFPSNDLSFAPKQIHNKSMLLLHLDDHARRGHILKSVLV